MPHPALRALLALLVLAAPLAAAAQDEASEPCDDVVEVDRFRLLRQLTLDLAGRVPTVDELEAVRDADDVGEAQVDALLAAPEFSNFVRRHHRDLLWPATDAIEVVNAAVALLLPAQLYMYEGDGDPDRLFLLFTGVYGRGGLVPCKDEPAEWDEDGNLIFETLPDGTRREGWVMVEPYWAPGTEVKVCALEARIQPVSETGVPCDTAQGLLTGTCGCGPNLQRCASIPVALDVALSLQEQVMRMVERPIAEGRPYTDALIGQTEEVNGPLVHYYRYLAPMALDPIILEPPVPVAELPDVPYGDAEWHPAPRAHAKHSGLLTSMSYLLRFQTDRARANRFYNAFLCEPFVAPPNGLPSPNDECSQEPNLRKRCGCNYCHGRLEPAAAYWGRFANAGTYYLDPATYPTYLARCAACAENPDRMCDFICDRFYVSEIGHPDEAPYAGVLKSYQWRDADEVAHVEAGPQALVEANIENGKLAQCVTRKVFERLYHRPMSPSEVEDELPALAADFAAGGYDFKALVKALVLHPGYRRMAR